MSLPRDGLALLNAGVISTLLPLHGLNVDRLGFGSSTSCREAIDHASLLTFDRFEIRIA